MEKRHLLLVVGLFATMILVMPSVYSLFAGQHNFYEKGSSNCLKCHSDIRLELDDSIYHQSFTCENCHASGTNSDMAHGNVANPECLDCHSEPGRLVTDSANMTILSPPAKVFGENIANNESHNSFVDGANATPMMKGANEACTSCHTAKSLTINMLYADTYKFKANRITDGTWLLSNYSKNVEASVPLLIQSNESHGQHSFTNLTQLKCEKCHPDTRDELNKSFHHTYFSCASCHELNSDYHASSTPQCLICHGTSPMSVTDSKDNTFFASEASVYADNHSGGADAHIPFVLGAENRGGNNIACTSCHSSFNKNASFIRPGYIEWDVVITTGNTWSIENLTFGPNNEVTIINHLDGKPHNISDITRISCISCHEDIMQAVIAGGHSNEQWKKMHDYTGFADMDSYCKSCHKPLTQDNAGTSPYPAYPFDSPVHGAMTISCMDCHGKSGELFVNLNGAMETPVYNSGDMGNIEESINLQPAFVRSYLCMACKNTGNPVPNSPLHFKLYTEPQVTIYINGTQRYP